MENDHWELGAFYAAGSKPDGLDHAIVLPAQALNRLASSDEHYEKIYIFGHDAQELGAAIVAALNPPPLFEKEAG